MHAISAAAYQPLRWPISTSAVLPAMTLLEQSAAFAIAQVNVVRSCQDRWPKPSH